MHQWRIDCGRRATLIGCVDKGISGICSVTLFMQSHDRPTDAAKGAQTPYFLFLENFLCAMKGS